MISKLGKEVWEEHIDVFMHFDLQPTNGHSLEDETKSNALFNALVTLSHMENTFKVKKAIEYLKCSKYYSEQNKESLH